MLKKLIYLLPFCLVFNAVAAPSVSLLGKNKPIVTVAKPSATIQKNQSTIKPNTARNAQSLAISKSKTDLSDSSARFPIIKPQSKTPVSNQNINTNTNSIKPVSSSVSESAFNSLVHRVEILETKNTDVVTDVVETGTGPYVNDVKKEDNELNIRKTHMLYAPVKNAGSETVSGNAEIWIIK